MSSGNLSSMGNGGGHNDGDSNRQNKRKDRRDAQQQDDSKRLRRLERNRDSARECRRRKKDRYEFLRQQLVRLEAENVQLRMKLKIGPEAASAQNEEIAQLTGELEAMVREGADDETIRHTISQIQEQHSDYGRDRRSAIDFHMNSLRRCLQPTQTTRSILWLLSCVPQFHNSVDGSPITTKTGLMAELWYSMLRAIDPTPEQNQRLVEVTMGSRVAEAGIEMAAGGEEGSSSGSSEGTNNSNTDSGVSEAAEAPRSATPTITFPDLQAATSRTNNMINRLQSLVANKNESLDSAMRSAQSCLTATQIAKFILWIEKNPVCLQMLDALWPQFQPSQVLSTAVAEAASAAGEYAEATAASTYSDSPYAIGGQGGSTGSYRFSVPPQHVQDEEGGAAAGVAAPGTVIDGGTEIPRAATGACGIGFAFGDGGSNITGDGSAAHAFVNDSPAPVGAAEPVRVRCFGSVSSRDPDGDAYSNS